MTGINSLLLAVNRQDVAIVKILLHWNCNQYIRGRIFKRRQHIEHLFDPFELAVFERDLDIMKLMFSAGYSQTCILNLFKRKDLPSSFHADEDIMSWVQEQASMPRSLLSLSVFAVRQVLQRRVVSDTDQLPLPARIKDLVLLKNVLNSDEWTNL